MINAVLNLLFRCSHRHLTRPITPVIKTGVTHGETYVVCLDCAKQFAYDLKEMRMGEAIDRSHDACVLPAKKSNPGRTKLKYALGVGVPLAVIIGSVLKAKKSTRGKEKKGVKTDSEPL